MMIYIEAHAVKRQASPHAGDVLIRVEMLDLNF